MKALLNYFTGVTLLLFLYSCLKPEVVPPVPAIEFKDYIKYGIDSADVSITFKDGDGDVGLEQSDTLPPFDPSSTYYNNIYLVYYYKGSDGLFHKYFNIPTQDTLKYAYRIPNITPTGQNKILDGEIKVTLRPAPIYVSGHTVVRFDVYIYDRALNKSNVITTPEITVP